MNLFKTSIAVCLFMITFPSFANHIELVGRLVENDGGIYLRYEEGNKIKRLQVHDSNRIFLGHQVWISGRIDDDKKYLHTDELVSERNSLVKSKVGQGVLLEGSLEPNSFKGLNFVIENKKTIEQLGGRKSLHVIWPKDHYLSNSNTYIHKAIIKGVVSGNNLYVSDEAYAVHTVSHKTEIKANDTLVFSGRLVENESGDVIFRDHFESDSSANSLTYGGNNDTYGINVQGIYIIIDPSDVYVQHEETGRLIPAEFNPKITATPADDKVYELIEEGVRMTFVGKMNTRKHLFISDAKPYSENAEVPQITSTPPRSKSKPPETVVTKTKTAKMTAKQRGNLKLVVDNLHPTPCDSSLAKPRPKLFIVPKKD